MQISYEGLFKSLNAPRKPKVAAGKRAPRVFGKIDRDVEQRTLDSFLVNQLEKRDYARFVNLYNPKRRQRAGFPRQSTVYEICEYLAAVNAWTNSHLASMRYALHVTDLQDNPSAWAGQQSQVLQMCASTAVDTSRFVLTMGQANNSVISMDKSGDVYFDLFGRYPNDENEGSAGMLPDFGNEYSVASSPASAKAQREDGYLSPKFVKPFKVYFDYIQKALYGKAVTKETAGQRVFARHPLDLDLHTLFKTAAQQFKKAGGAFLPETLPELPRPAQLALMPNLQMLLYYEPTAEVRFALMSKGDGPDYDIDEDYLCLGPGVTTSFSMHLPKQYAEYVSQCGKGKPRLTSLNTWFNAWCVTYIRAPKSNITLSARDFPLYILSSSMLPHIDKKREELGLYREPGRANDHNLTINPQGGMSYIPKADQLSIENAKAVENISDDILEACFNAGTCWDKGNNRFLLKTQKAYSTVKENVQRMDKFAGALQAYSWDYNCVITNTTADASRSTSTKTLGSTVPTSLNVGTYLREPFNKGFVHVLNNATYREQTPDGARNKGLRAESISSADASVLAASSPVIGLANVYAYLEAKKLVPSLDLIIAEAAKQLELKTLDLSAVTEGRALLDKDVYQHWLTTGLKLTRERSLPEDTANILTNLFEIALTQSAGRPKSTLWKYAQEAGEDPTETPYFFDAESSSLAEIRNVYSFLGGRIIYLVAKAVDELERKDNRHLYLIDPNFDGPRLPPFNRISQDVMPFVKLLVHYAPNAEKIYEEADKESEALKPNESFDVSDLKLIGFKKGFQLFPHQVDAFKTLSTFPRFALLDIAPGGGKTALVLSDIANCVAHGKVRRPVVLCPNNLVKDWCAELHDKTEGRWNVIPCVSNVYTTKWGDARLTELIKNAPINTVIVVGYTVLSQLNSYKYKVVINNHAELVSETLEFVKKIGPDYIALDESHRTKRFGGKARRASFVHTTAKALTTMSCVKYVRLATGSFIYNNMADAVGQTALLTAQVFRTLDDYEEENKIRDESGRAGIWRKDTPVRARRRLGDFAAVISAKRRDWAFMLPIPIETIIPVNLEKSPEDADYADLDPAVRLAHRACYEAVLNETMEQITQNKDLMNILKGKKGEDDDDDDEDTPKGRTIQLDSGGNIQVVIGEEDEETLEKMEAALQPYLQRLDRILTDPLNDVDAEGTPFGQVFFKGLGAKDFVSNVVQAVYKRLDKHFNVEEFKYGQQYSPQTITMFKGKSYIARADKPIAKTPAEMFAAVKDPLTDKENWTEQENGKVIIFCRYTRTVDAIYRSLPAKYVKMAVRFHGGVENAAENLEKFKKDPTCRIIIANEQSISEGHNLQMASRIIRVETPWAPGELDQAMSRIFRPDPTKRYKRETIFLDWIIANRTIAVAKLGRIISKIIDKTQFDEADNANYSSFNEKSLPIISMSLDNLRELNNLNDVKDYIDTYQQLVSIQGSEFLNMRKTRKMEMLDVPLTPMPAEASIIEFTPYAQGQTVFDRHGLGIIRYMDWVQNLESQEVREVLADPSKLVGQFAHTEFGNGVVESVYKRRGSKVETEGDDEDAEGENVSNMLSRARVRLSNGDIADVPAGLLYLARKMTADKMHMFTGQAEKATGRSRKIAAALEPKIQQALKRDENRRTTGVRKPRTDGGSGRATPTSAPAPTGAKLQQITGSVYPVLYNGFWCLEVDADAQVDKWLKRNYQFDGGRDYLYIPIKNGANFDRVLAFLTSKFTLAQKVLDELRALRAAFTKTGRNLTFKPELAPVSQLPLFYSQRHRMVQSVNPRKPTIRPYGVVLGTSVMLVLDIATNPQASKLVNKSIPGTTPVARVESADSISMRFFKTRSELASTVNAMRRDGFVVQNYTELKEQLEELKPIAAKFKAKAK